MKKRSQVRVGLVLPEAYFGSEEWKNAQMALRYVDEENLSRPESPDMKRIGCRPGQIYERRPELCQELARPHDFSYDCFYFERDLDAWEQEYDRIYWGGYREIREKHGEFDFG